MIYNNVTRKNNIISIKAMDHPSIVSRFIIELQQGLRAGYLEYDIDVNCNRYFPNACTPISGIIDFYKAKYNIEFSFTNIKGTYLDKCKFTQPLYQTCQELKSCGSIFDTILIYDESSQIYQITQSFVDSISHFMPCGSGVLDGLIWCISEVMDNVLTHSQAKYGYIMGQIHPQTKHVAFCIYDTGIGIYNSLKRSKHNPKTPLDAITLAIQEGIGDGSGQGNGLYGLQQIVSLNTGRFTITSGSGSLMSSKIGEMKTFDKIPFLDTEQNGTTVDFQLDLDKEINIKEAFSSIGGHDIIDMRIENMLQDNNFILYDVYKQCAGTATRISGASIRNDVINTIKRSNTGIILDFSGVKTVSSSFIDEFLSKLIIELGIIRFNSLVRIIGMNETISFLADRSTTMRIHDTWGKLKE